MERALHAENGDTILDGGNVPGGERPTFLNGVDLEYDRCGGITRAHKICVKGVDTPVGCGGTDGGGEGLGRNLATEGAGKGGRDDGAAENIAVELFNVENGRNFRLVGFLMAGGMIGGTGHGFLHTWG